MSFSRHLAEPLGSAPFCSDAHGGDRERERKGKRRRPMNCVDSLRENWRKQTCVSVSERVTRRRTMALTTATRVNGDVPSFVPGFEKARRRKREKELGWRRCSCVSYSACVCVFWRLRHGRDQLNARASARNGNRRVTRSVTSVGPAEQLPIATSLLNCYKWM